MMGAATRELGSPFLDPSAQFESLRSRQGGRPTTQLRVTAGKWKEAAASCRDSLPQTDGGSITLIASGMCKSHSGVHRCPQRGELSNSDSFSEKHIRDFEMLWKNDITVNIRN